MALLFADSFEHYGTGATSRTNLLQGEYAYLTTSFVQVSVNNPRTGNRSFYASNTGYFSEYSALRKVVNTTSNEIGFAIGIYPEALPSVNNRRGIAFKVGDTSIVTISFGSSGEFVVHRGRLSQTIIGSTDVGLLLASAYTHLEVRLLRDNVVGEIEIRVNGQIELILTDLDLGLIDIDSFAIVGQNDSTVFYFDDLIIWDSMGDVNNTFFGPARVLTVWPDSDESGNQWSITGAATGAAALTETTPDGDTSYVSSAVVGNKSEFSIGGLPPESEVIAGVYIPSMAKLASAGVGNLQVSLVSGTDVSSGKDNPLTTAYTYRGDVFEKDPATEQQWSKSGLEAAKIRIEKTA